MASVSEILSAVSPETLSGSWDGPIDTVACHPSGISGPNCLFVCINEYLEYNRWQTWRTYLEELPALGVKAVVLPELIPGLDVAQLVTPEPRKALGQLARLLSGHPDLYSRVYGVTGTNGKTTTTRLLAYLLNQLGEPCGSIGTLGITLPGHIDEPGTYTTPLASQLYGELARLRSAGAKGVAMEVSSHGLALDRVGGMAFEAAILTNVERDHLDFHGTHEAYAAAKRQLFSRVRNSGWCILNRQSPFCDSFAEASTGKVVTYGEAGRGADLELLDFELHPTVSRFTLRFNGTTCAFETQLVGKFQLENAMGAIALLAALGFDLTSIAAALPGFPSVCGRMERFSLPNGSTIIVDYAHNPDGLKHLLENGRLLCRGKLHLVFGCGGDRDRGKRPIMGELAAGLADVAWITSDNPRTEDPRTIMDDIEEGTRKGTASILKEPDREAAIRGAYAGTSEGDVLLVAGKGHEDYQLIGYTKFPFSDQAVVGDLGGA
ncbi:MAG: UDP-N-acetylmuramoyl-L-alanyl-D-glutamate--2,6-diaminopimelate ligase [Puniceicoccaceae bacterium]